MMKIVTAGHGQAAKVALVLSEYSFNAADGEPEGCVFAATHEDAAREWGMSESDGSTRLVCVWGPGHDARWFRIERTRDGVDARECSL